MRINKATLLPSGQCFEVGPGEIILTAAIRQSVDVAYTCRNGTCRTCIFKVIEGDAFQEAADYCMLSAPELDNGLRMLCMSTLRSNAVLEKYQRKRKSAIES